MNYLLDSDAISIFYDGQREPFHSNIHLRVASLDNSDSLHCSVLTLCELEYGLANAPAKKKQSIRSAILSIRRDFDEILPLDEEVAPVFGRMKAWFKYQGNLDRRAIRKHNIDLLLACTALATSSILVGTDRIYKTLRDFDASLEVEDWLSAEP